MDREALVKRLMATFVVELSEHVGSMSRAVLAFERDPNGPERAELVKSLFRSAHSLKGAARSVNAGTIEITCHRLEEVLGRVRDGTRAPDAELFQSLLADIDVLAEEGKKLRAARAKSSEPAAAPESIRTAPAAPPPASEPPAIEPAPTPDASSTFTRVASAKLDTLLDRGGELLVACRRIADRAEDVKRLQTVLARGRRGTRRIAARADGEAWREAEREAERLAAELAADVRFLQQIAFPLEEEIRRVRMLPFAEACDGLPRAARDLAHGSGKDVELVIEGADVELDRSVLERLKDPLLHLVRNAIDHGIEPRAERARAGKPARARVTVGASLRGGSVRVEVSDDGRGLDMEAIRAEAQRRGLPEAADAREAARQIFLPGLSTSPRVTEVSGRGVGLDVVKSRVEALHGAVELSFEPGRGTRFSLTVPLTLTVTRVLLVRAGGQAFAFVSASVLRAERVGAERLCSIEGRQALLGAGAPLPVLSLADAIALRTADSGSSATASGKLLLVVVSAHDGEAAFAVDELIAEQDVVIKGLGARLRRARHFSGATVLPTGEIALVLNAADLVRTALGAGPRRPLAIEVAGQAAPRKRLLVVDDSVTTRTLVKSILEGEGYDVVAASDGAEAWQILQARGADLVVSDVEMPRLDGFGLTSTIRASKRLRDVPVVLVTALASDADRARGIAAGASAYLVKSAFDQRRLLEIIRQLL